MQPFSIRTLTTLINWKVGIIGGLILGSIVIIINLAATDPTDWFGSLTAGVKQFIYTLFVGGFITNLAIKMSLSSGANTSVIARTTAFIAILASSLVYIVHSLKGTPEPALSTLPAFLFTILLLPPLLKQERNKKFNSKASYEAQVTTHQSQK